MAITVKHAKVSSIPDGTDTSLVLPSDWNNDHTLVGTVDIANGGTGQTTASNAFNALSPVTSTGDLIVGNGVNSATRLPIGANAQVLTSNGTTATWATPSGGGGGSALTISNKTVAYTVVAGDLGQIIKCTSGTFTVNLTAAATLGSGFNCWIWNTSITATDVITIDPSGTETIDGRTTLTLRRGEGMQIVCNGTDWDTGDKKRMRGYSENIATNQPPTASGSAAFAIGQDCVASGAASIAMGDGADATSANSVAIGQSSGGTAAQAVSGAGAIALGGAYASGTDSFAVVIGTNSSAYGAKASGAFAVGPLALASGTNSIAIGAKQRATGSYSTSIGSDAVSGNTISGNYSIGIGDEHNVTAQFATAIGRGVKIEAPSGKYGYAGGRFLTAGDAQTGTVVLIRQTTDATPTALANNNETASATNQLIVPNNSAYAFSGIIVARRQASGGTESAAWKVEGLVRREGTAASTTLVASTVTAISNVPGWTLALSANTTNGGLAVTFTGAAATNIRTVATIQTSEVTYA